MRLRRRPGAALGLTSAFDVVVPDARALRLFVLKGRLALRADALGLGVTGAARQFDVVHHSIGAEMAGDGKVVHGTDVGCFHFLP